MQEYTTYGIQNNAETGLLQTIASSNSEFKQIFEKKLYPVDQLLQCDLEASMNLNTYMYCSELGKVTKLYYAWFYISHTPFTKASLNYLHKNNADNSIKNCIHKLLTSGQKKKPRKDRWACGGKGWPLTAPWKLPALFWNCIHKFRSLVCLVLMRI